MAVKGVILSQKAVDKINRLLRRVDALEKELSRVTGKRQPLDAPWLKKGVLDGDLAYEGSATVSIWGRSSGSEADTGTNVTAYDWLLEEGETLESGTKVFLGRAGGLWYVVAPEPPVESQARYIEFELTAALTTSDATAAADVLHFSDGDDPGASVSVTNGQGAWAGAIGAVGGAVYDPENDAYRIIWLACASA